MNAVKKLRENIESMIHLKKPMLVFFLNFCKHCIFFKFHIACIKSNRKHTHGILISYQQHLAINTFKSESVDLSYVMYSVQPD